MEFRILFTLGVVKPLSMLTSGLRGLLITILLFTATESSFSQVFFENFNSESNNATSGTAVGGSWTTEMPGGGTSSSFSKQTVIAPYLGILQIDNTVGEGVWRSNEMNIAPYGEVALEVLMGGYNATGSDYVRAYYKIDQGPEVLFAEVVGSAGVFTFTGTSAVVSGGTLQIVIRGKDSSGGLMGFDDVTVTDIEVLYSRLDGNWNSTATWSKNGFSGGSCSCTPNDESRVIIGDGKTVNMNTSGTAAGVEIRNTGTLAWTNNNVALTVARGGAVDVQSGGTLTRGTRTGSSIQFSNYTYSINVAGVVDVGVIQFTASGNSTLNNSGSINLATANGLVIVSGNGYVFNNSGTFSFQNLSLSSNDITVNNSGTINQTGNFANVDAGSRFNNLPGGTWNFGGTGISGVRLFANNNSNTFNYNGAAQTIILPQDAYSNLVLSGSGAKTASGSFAVNGNWTRSGATFTQGGNRVTFSGDIPQSVNSSGTETFSNLTINNSSATSPQITLNCAITVSTNLTMTRGNINLNGNAFAISSTSGTALTHTRNASGGWMYGGTLTRNFSNGGSFTLGNIEGYFPLGGETFSRPFFLGKSSPNGQSPTSVTVSYTDASTATDVNFTDNGTQIVRRHDSFWTVSANNTGGNFSISAGGMGFTVGNIAQTRLTRHSDASSIGTPLVSGGTTTDVRASRSGLTGSNLTTNFYLASTNAIVTPLPIALEYFTAKVEGDEVVTSWKTTKERNNHFFTVEKTTDFESFFNVGELTGKGDTDAANVYSMVDPAPAMGRSYYRLKQTDFDGAFTFSDPVMIEYQGPSSPFVKVYPNPSNGSGLVVEVKGLTGVPSVPVGLFNQQGQKVLDVVIDESGAGVFHSEITLGNKLAPGIYILKAGRTLQLTTKVIVY